MQSYNITDDAIKWKSVIPSETTPSAESTPIINMEELSNLILMSKIMKTHH
jgi:hypothetical protein